MAYYPWKNNSSIIIPDATKIEKGIPDSVKLNDTIWPITVNNGESPPPINEARWGEKTLCISMKSLVNNKGSNVLHLTPFKILRSNIAKQGYDNLSSTSIDGLSTPRDGFNSDDPEVGDKFQTDTTNATIIHDKIFVSTNDSIIYKLQNINTELEPEYIIREIIDPADLYPTKNRTAMTTGLDNARSKIWICQAVNEYLFVVFVNKLFILKYDMEATMDYSIRYQGYLPDMNTRYSMSTCDNMSPYSPGRYNEPSTELPEYTSYINWKDQAFVNHINSNEISEENQLEFNNNLISPMWMGEPSVGYFIIYNTSAFASGSNRTPWPLWWSLCSTEPTPPSYGGEYGGEYGSYGGEYGYYGGEYR